MRSRPVIGRSRDWIDGAAGWPLKALTPRASCSRQKTGRKASTIIKVASDEAMKPAAYAAAAPCGRDSSSGRRHMCQSCDRYDSTVQIRGPRQLRRIAEKVRDAVSTGALRCNEFESSRALISQPPFSELNLESTIPDVLRYYFECPLCGAAFGLVVETFHGQGGQWSRLKPGSFAIIRTTRH